VRKGRDIAVRWFQEGEVSPRWNYFNLYRDIAWYGVISAVSATFVSVYTLRLGGSNLLLGLLTSLPAFVNVLVQIPAARVIERQVNPRRLLLWAGFWMRASVFLSALVPLFLHRWQANAVVWITALGTIPAAASTTAFTAMLADVVKAKDRARVVSVRNMLLAAVSMLTMVVAGEALDVLPFPLSYQLIFTLAFAASLLSLYYVGRIAIPDREPMVQKIAGTAPGWRQLLRAAWSERAYRRFVLAAFLFHWALDFPIPLYAIYRVRVLNISEGWIGTMAMVESALTVLSWYVWGRVAQRRGSRFVLLLGVLGLCFYPFGTALSRGPWPLLLVSAIAGIVAPAFNLGLFNGMLEVTPQAHRPTYVGLYNMLLNVPACIAPLLSTVLAGWMGVRTALFLGGGLRVVGFVAFALLLTGPVRRAGATH
jgi:MFS family permease